MSTVEWDINDNNIPSHISSHDEFEEWPTGHTKLVYRVSCQQADKHHSGWAMRNTNNHNVNILKKSCLGVLVCSNRCTFENSQSIHMRPAICDKARRKQQGKPCPNSYCTGRLEILSCRGHCGYPVTHFWRHTPAGIFFQAKGTHDHPRPEAKSTAESKRGLRPGSRSILKRKSFTMKYNFPHKKNCVEIKPQDLSVDLFSAPPKIQRIVTTTSDINDISKAEHQRVPQEGLNFDTSQFPFVYNPPNPYPSQIEHHTSPQNELVNFFNYDVNASYVQNDIDQCKNAYKIDNSDNHWADQLGLEIQWTDISSDCSIKAEAYEDAGSYSDCWYQNIPSSSDYEGTLSHSPGMYDSFDQQYSDSDRTYPEASDFDNVQDIQKNFANENEGEFQTVCPEFVCLSSQFQSQNVQNDSWWQREYDSQTICTLEDSGYGENIEFVEQFYQDYDFKNDVIVAEAIGCVPEVGQFYQNSGSTYQLDASISCSFVNKQSNQFNTVEDLIPVYV